MAFVDARVEAAIDASVSGATHIQLHTGDPGASGTSNVAAGISRVSISWDAVGSLAKVGTGSFPIPGPGGPFTHVSLWSASSGGTFYGYATANPAESFAGAGSLAATLTISGQSS